MKLIIEDDEGRKTVVALGREEITIGRQPGNTVQLVERNVSRRHARLVPDDGLLLIEDLGSSNGVHVNGDRIAGPTKIKEGDLIEIGDYDLGVERTIEAVAAPPQVAASTRSARPLTMPPPPPPDFAPPAAGQASPAGPGAATAIIRIADLAKAAPQVEARDLQESEMPRLIGLAGAVRGRELYLSRTDVKVGRGEDNDLAIEHPSISRQHARFVLDGGVWKVIDNHSANGVQVNGEPYAMSAVHPGDTVELGHVKFRFCAPGETSAVPPEASDDPQPAPRPEPAESIPGDRAGPAPPARNARTLRYAIAVGIPAAILASGAVLFLRNSGPPAAIKAALLEGDAAFERHDYLHAVELYEQAAASGETSPNMRLAVDEARGQQANQQLEKAIAARDFDRAKVIGDKCAADPGFWCRKAQEKLDAIRQGYSAIHLAKAQSKSGIRPEQCRDEVQLVLAFDPANPDAQAIHCAPAAATAAVHRAAARPAGPSLKDRDAKAKQLITDGNSLSTAKDYPAAIAKYAAALETRPSGQYVGLAYRGLGTAAAYQSDGKAAAKWFKLYLPYAPDEATKTQVTQLIQRFGGQPELAR